MACPVLSLSSLISQIIVALRWLPVHWTVSWPDLKLIISWLITSTSGCSNYVMLADGWPARDQTGVKMLMLSSQWTVWVSSPVLVIVLPPHQSVQAPVSAHNTPHCSVMEHKHRSHLSPCFPSKATRIILILIFKILHWRLSPWNYFNWLWSLNPYFTQYGIVRLNFKKKPQDWIF